MAELVDELLRYGLFLGAIFQLVCIAAVVFVPPKEEGKAVVGAFGMTLLKAMRRLCNKINSSSYDGSLLCTRSKNEPASEEQEQDVGDSSDEDGPAEGGAAVPHRPQVPHHTGRRSRQDRKKRR